MSINSPLLSIIVPTRNRSKYAIRMIDSILCLSSRDFELVVGDNSDDDQLETYVNGLAPDNRLKYQRVPGILSMTENHNLAFERACGDYVILIGDDDTVLPSVFEVASWAKAEGWEAVSPVSIPSYVWPDARHWFFGGGLAERTFFLPFSGKPEKANACIALKECLDHAGQGVYNLPKIYHGIVRRDCLESIRKKTGTYFQGASPDVYGALALGVVINKYCHLDYPMSIAGIGGGSNSGRAAQKQHKGELGTDPHMKAFTGLTWPSEIPNFFSVETVWAEASLEAINAFNLDLSLFNLNYLYARCLFGHPFESKRILSHYFLRKNFRAFWKINFFRLMGPFLGILYKETMHLIRRAMRPTRRGWQQELFGGEDINTASQKFQDWLGSCKIRPRLGPMGVE